MSWRYLLTEKNTADDITRGLRSAGLSIGHRYNDGHEFLYEKKDRWPNNKVVLRNEKEEMGWCNPGEGNSAGVEAVFIVDKTKRYSIYDAIYSQKKGSAPDWPA